MTDISMVGPDGGELVLTGPVRMRILEDGSTTGHRLGTGEITVATRTDGPAQHRHGRHDEGFYVVSGAARFTVGDTSYDAGPGTLVMIPPGAPHTFANPGADPVVLLNTFTPDVGHLGRGRPDRRSRLWPCLRRCHPRRPVQAVARHRPPPAA